MPYDYGALDIPVQVPATGDRAGEPALTKLLAFFRDVLNADGQTSWQTASPGQPVVRTISAHRPDVGTFHERELPALFGFREGSAPQRLADQVEASRDRVVVLWVPEPAPQENEVRRLAFSNAIVKILHAALYQERNPAWIDAGDTDPDRTTFGSWLLGRTELSAPPRIVGAQRAQVVVPMADGSPPREYEALRIELELLELLEPGLVSPIAEPAKISADVTVSDETHGDLLIVEFDDPTIPP